MPSLRNRLFVPCLGKDFLQATLDKDTCARRAKSDLDPQHQQQERAESEGIEEPPLMIDIFQAELAHLLEEVSISICKILILPYFRNQGDNCFGPKYPGVCVFAASVWRICTPAHQHNQQSIYS